MRTKYSQLLKVKKQAVDALENSISILNAIINSFKMEIESIENEISSINRSKKGRYTQFLAENYSFERLYNIKKGKELILKQREEELQKIQKRYKEALIEYEKIKYLEDVIVQEKLKKLKKEEEKLLDEVSLMTYKRRSF